MIGINTPRLSRVVRLMKSKGGLAVGASLGESLLGQFGIKINKR